MKTIYVNGRFLTKPLTGISRFTYEICKALSEILDFKIIVPHNSILPIYDVSMFDIVEYGNLKSHLWEQISLYQFIRKQKNAVLLSLSGLGPILLTKKISSIHDLSFMSNPKWFSRKYYWIYRILTPLIIKTSQYIITVSEFSKGEILRYYNTDPDKIIVVYNAVNFNSCETKTNEKENFVLSVGSMDPRKNFKVLLEVFSDPRLKNINLHIVGGNDKVFGKIGFNPYNHSNIRFLGRVSEEELANEYSRASLFILPSLYEGFGIPPLEALCFNCPAAVSDIPVFHEIYEKSVIYFNPTDKEDIIKTILNYKSLCNSISPSDIKKVQRKYDWHLSALSVKNLLLRD